jgi:hypothetical protein
MAKKEKTKWKWNEYQEWKDQKEKSQDEPVETPVRSGQCDECGHGSFQLRIKAGQMDRICKGCGVIKENV